MHSLEINSLRTVAKYTTGLVSGVCAFMAGAFGASLSPVWIGQVGLATICGFATLVVAYSLVFGDHAFRAGRYFKAAAWVMVFAISVSVELMSHVGFTASHRSSDIEKAQFKTTSYVDRRKEIAGLEARLKQIDTALNMSKALPAPETYDEQIRLKRKQVDAESKIVKCGRRCIAYQSELASLIAEQAMAAKRHTLVVDRKLLVQELMTARRLAKKSGGKGLSSASSQSAILASIATLNDKPDAKAQYWSNIGVSTILAVFAVVIGLVNWLVWSADSVATGTREIVRDGVSKVAEAAEAAVEAAQPVTQFVPAVMARPTHQSMEVGTAKIEGAPAAFGFVPLRNSTA